MTNTIHRVYNSDLEYHRLYDPNHFTLSPMVVLEEPLAHELIRQADKGSTEI